MTGSGNGDDFALRVGTFCVRANNCFNATAGGRYENVEGFSPKAYNIPWGPAKPPVLPTNSHL